MAEQIWYQAPARLFTPTNYAIVIPVKDMTFEQQLNSIVRLSVYFSAVVLAVKHDVKVLYVMLFTMALTYLMNEAHAISMRQVQQAFREQNVRLNKQNEPCTLPSRENPFGNVLMSEYTDNPQRPKACAPWTKQATKGITKHFNAKLYRDVDDIYMKNASDRQWYTTPSTTIPNDAVKFAKWLYQTGPTCKEGNGLACNPSSSTS